MKLNCYTCYFGDKNEYRTPEGKKAFFPAAGFYYRLAKVLISSWRSTKKNEFNRYKWADASFGVIKALEGAGIRFHIKGIDNVKKLDKPAVIIGNHMSTTETTILPSIIQPITNVVYVMKKELVDYPVFGPVGKARHPIVVGRANPREDLKIVLEDGKSRIRDGRSVVIFPQRTRSEYFDRSKFNSLGVKLAKMSNAYVLPLALLTDAWGNGKYVKEVGKLDPKKEMKLEFGEPFEVTGKGNEEHERVLDFIESRLIEWNRPELIIKP